MDYFKKIEEIAENQNGTLLSSDLDENGIPRAYLSMMVAEGNLEKVGRGAYVVSNQIEDEMYIFQKKYPNLIYSHETALFLHGVSDRTPSDYSANVPSGYKVVSNLSDRFKMYYVKKNLHGLGVIEGETPFGNTIKLYNIERTLCDLLRSRSRIDIQIFSDAFQKVMKDKQIDAMLLLEYARKLRVESVLNTYMEVLLWVRKPWV